MKIVKSCPIKSCALDPIPASLFSACIDILITPLTNIVNYSLKEGRLPNCFKIAHVLPLLKKENLDKNTLKTIGLSPTSALFQSSLKRLWHSNSLASSTKIASQIYINQPTKSLAQLRQPLLKIQNDIALSMNSKQLVALALLDLSAAFDTIDHHILLDSL